MNPRYPRVAQRAAHLCEYCHAPESIFNFPFEVEHIIPPNRGGSDDETNWALACRSCNLHKAHHLDGADAETGVVAKLFHPRQDRWEEHFRIDAATTSILGRTPVGRATVERLRLNRASQLAARRQWMRLGLFPPA